MQINSSRLVPNQFYGPNAHQDSYREPVTPIKKAPFTDIANTSALNSHKKRKVPRTPKTFVEL